MIIICNDVVFISEKMFSEAFSIHIIIVIIILIITSTILQFLFSISFCVVLLLFFSTCNMYFFQLNSFSKPLL